MKIWLWFLGAAALLNVGADIWFRTSISASTHAPWYVWTPAVVTVAVGIVTLLAQYVIGRRTDEPAQVVEYVAVELPRVERFLPLADARARALVPLRAAGLNPDEWEPEIDPDYVLTLHSDGFWRHRVLFRRTSYPPAPVRAGVLVGAVPPKDA